MTLKRDKVEVTPSSIKVAVTRSPSSSNKAPELERAVNSAASNFRSDLVDKIRARLGFLSCRSVYAFVCKSTCIHKHRGLSQILFLFPQQTN